MAGSKLEEIRRDFSQNTSCHGPAQVHASTAKLQRAFWCLLILIVVGALISQLAIIIREYRKYETTTSISEKYNESFQLPAVTICNFNHYFGIETKEEKEAIDELAKARSYSGGETDLNKIKYFDKVYNGSIREYSIGKGWQLDEDTLIGCSVGNDPCTPENFTYSITEMGKCWTYRSGAEIFGAGSRYGLTLVVSVQQVC